MPWSVGDVDSHKKGLSDKQKRQWTRIANSVLKRCMDKGGSEESCAASAIRQANGVVNANVKVAEYSTYRSKQKLDYDVKLTVHQEKAHLVVPVTMMVEGVHNGSQGAIYHSIEELGKFPASWNGIPVIVNHPQINGEYVSANQPEIVDKEVIGKVFNTDVDGTKLKAEAWIDEDKLSSLHPEVLEAINNGEEMEVSLGMFTENEEVEGEWNGEKYERIARNHRPDHLALLPDAVGACSCEDGCGIGANEYNDNMKIDITGKIEGKDLLFVLRRMNREGFALAPIGNNQAQGYRERMDAVYSTLNGLNKEGSYHYLEEMYDDELIYNKSSDGGTTMYKQSYKFESGKIEFVGEPIEVHKKVEYVTNNLTNFKKEVKMANECAPCIKKKVDDLIANSQGRWTEDDREMLQTLSEAMLDKIAKPVEKEVVKTVEVNKLTADDQAALEYGKKQLKERREGFVKSILDNTEKGTWSEDKLKSMDDETLESISKSIKREEVVDYSLGAPVVYAGKDEIEPMTFGVNTETKK